MRHNRIPLVSLVVIALVVSAFAAAQLSSGQPQPGTQPLKMKVWREKSRVRHSPNVAEVAAFKKTVQEDERKIEDSIPKHIPIKIKIKREKEAGFKDLKNERWAKEFELEVTNTGTKPIYSLYLYVVTDVKAAAGFRIVFPLYYGRDELGDIKKRAEPTDVPIEPGESISLSIHSGQLDAWDLARRKENRPFPKRLEVTFQFLSFGDGSGYAASDGQELPRKTPEEEGAGACLPGPLIDPFGWQDLPPGSAVFKLFAFNLPVTWPVNFLRGADSETVPPGFPLLETCCGSSNCSALIVVRENVCVNCPPQNRAGVAICSDPNRLCGTTVSDYTECLIPKSNESYFCQTIDIRGCGTPPPPAPSPTASPSPSPSPTPTPCPLALPSECPGGCREILAVIRILLRR